MGLIGKAGPQGGFGQPVTRPHIRAYPVQPAQGEVAARRGAAHGAEGPAQLPAVDAGFPFQLGQ